MNAQTVAGRPNLESQEFFFIYLLSLSDLKLSHKVCIVEAWVERGDEMDVPEGRGGAERGGSVEETVRAEVAPE
jgi:hypothetical protein